MVGNGDETALGDFLIGATLLLSKKSVSKQFRSYSAQLSSGLDGGPSKSLESFFGSGETRILFAISKLLIRGFTVCELFLFVAM